MTQEFAKTVEISVRGRAYYWMENTFGATSAPNPPLARSVIFAEF